MAFCVLNVKIQRFQAFVWPPENKLSPCSTNRQHVKVVVCDHQRVGRYGFVWKLIDHTPFGMSLKPTTKPFNGLKINGWSSVCRYQNIFKHIKTFKKNRYHWAKPKLCNFLGPRRHLLCIVLVERWSHQFLDHWYTTYHIGKKPLVYHIQFPPQKKHGYTIYNIYFFKKKKTIGIPPQLAMFNGIANGFVLDANHRTTSPWLYHGFYLD